jgi:hypothetical protein
MAFQISPGVNVSEVDLTTVVPSVLTTAGAFAGYFTWGPVNLIKTIDNEITLASTFGKPDSNSATPFFTSASFLAYGNNLKVVRAVGANCRNAVANTTAVNLQIQSESVFESLYLNSQNNGNQWGAFFAKYPGALGNSLCVSVIDAGASFSNWTVNGINVSGYFNGAPGSSSQISAAGGANDEIHIIVTDANGLFTGTKNTVLEVYPYLSKATDSTDALGNSNYYKNVLFNTSKYVYAVDPVDYANTISTWGTTMANKFFATVPTAQTVTLTKGTDEVPATANTAVAYSVIANTEDLDISLILTGDANITIQQYAIDNIAAARKDCIAFISPPSSNVINQAGNEATNITNWMNALARSSSYAVADSGWKYMFDKYNNVYRYVPLNGDIAGLCVNTDNVRDPWFSPAGLNRGQIKNAVKLAYNPGKTQRDILYAMAVNPVSSFAGSGIVLYGDKTLQVKPSAFDRINVRRLFIVLEKAIAVAAKYSLFEFNDEFTRAQFVALVTPFLRDIQGRRGIYDFRVVCDSTNNTDQVISSNQFVGDIYVKPARAINFIQLNFVAVRTGVDFTEVVGKF